MVVYSVDPISNPDEALGGSVIRSIINGNADIKRKNAACAEYAVILSSLIMAVIFFTNVYMIRNLYTNRPDTFFGPDMIFDFAGSFI